METTVRVAQEEVEVFTSPMLALYRIPLRYKPMEEMEEIKSFPLEHLLHHLPWKQMDPVAVAAVDTFPYQTEPLFSK